MTENSYQEFVEVKQEGIEDTASEDCSDKLSNCCLCPEAEVLQNYLVEHLKSCQKDCIKQQYNCCDCKEGLAIQIELVNHLLSHIPLPTIKDEKKEIFLINTNRDLCETPDASPLDTVKTKKPSYHNQFNRRERSPETQRLQSEFTQCLETKMFFCKVCRNSYKHKQSVERHLLNEHDPRRKLPKTSGNDATFSDSDSKLFYCSICRNGYKHKQTIERHLLKEHNVVIEKNRLTRSLKPTVEKEQRKKEKSYFCDMCGQSYRFRESLRKHLLRHLNPANSGKAGKVAREKIICFKCCKMVDPSVMKRHFQVHHSDYRPFRCEEIGCKTTFFDITKYRDHKNLHLGIRPYVCEFCAESFHYASNYRQHKLRHTEPEKFKCATCSSCFVSSKSLRMHSRLHTDDPSAPKQFPCEFAGCDKEFRYKDRLNLHIFNVHRKEPEIRCNICPFVCNKRKNYNRHMLKAHKIREKTHPRHRVFPVSKLD